MTPNDTPRQRDASPSETTAAGRATRRTFLRAAGAGTGALAFGATMPGGAAANQGDGPGQDIPTPRLHVEGNLIKDPEGNTVKLRGLNVADPRRLDATAPARGKNAVQTIDYLTNQDEGWHPRVMRLPVHPGDIGGLTPIPEADETYHAPPTFDLEQLQTYCEQHLDPAVDRCAERGVYAIIDYHRHWDAGELPFTDPDLDEEISMFWDYVAERYGDREHVLFEVYNEPVAPQIAGQFVDQEGNVHQDWLDWRDTCGEWIDIIREHSENIVLVGSPLYSQHPEGVVAAPFPQDDLAYTYHIYPQHGVSQDRGWDEEDSANESVVLFQDGTAAYEEAPLFVTEFGWEDPDLDTFYLLQGTREEFGDPFFDFLESHDAISWTAWCADPIWRPVMFTRGFLDEDPADPVDRDSIGENPYTGEVPQRCDDLPCEWELLTEEHGEYMGGVVRDILYETRNDGIPGTSGDGGGDDDGDDGDDDGDGGTEETPCEEVGAEAGAELENGDWVCDLDGDGNYRDLTASGDTTTQDLQHFFERQHRDPWNSRTDLFDFTGNDDVGQPDVVDLFHAI